MTKENNIRAILETHFTGFKEEIIDSAVNRLMEIIDDELSPSRPKGKWIRIDDKAHGIVSKVVKCSLCNKNAGLSEEYFWHLSKFCPNCGALMDIEEEVN